MLQGKTAPQTLKQAIGAGTLGIALAVMTSSAAAQANPEDGKGKQYYDKVCAKCHEVGTGPVLKGRGFPAITYVIIARNGNRAMPAFRVSDVDDATLQAVADYLASTPVKP
jgi:mono/diheme cytochrome c family protein